jgi:hypothetical protein
MVHATDKGPVVHHGAKVASQERQGKYRRQQQVLHQDNRQPPRPGEPLLEIDLRHGLPAGFDQVHDPREEHQ